jgi:predicted ribonuclease YlaK
VFSIYNIHRTQQKAVLVERPERAAAVSAPIVGFLPGVEESALMMWARAIYTAIDLES